MEERALKNSEWLLCCQCKCLFICVSEEVVMENPCCAHATSRWGYLPNKNGREREGRGREKKERERGRERHLQYYAYCQMNVWGLVEFCFTKISLSVWILCLPCGFTSKRKQNPLPLPEGAVIVLVKQRVLIILFVSCFKALAVSARDKQVQTFSFKKQTAVKRGELAGGQRSSGNLHLQCWQDGKAAGCLNGGNRSSLGDEESGHMGTKARVRRLALLEPAETGL